MIAMISLPINLLVVVLVIFCSCNSPAQAGRLGDKIHQKLEELHQRLSGNPAQVPQPTEAGKHYINPYNQHMRGGQVVVPIIGQQQPIPAQAPQQQPVPIQGLQVQPLPIQVPHQPIPVQSVSGQGSNLGPVQNQQKQQLGLGLNPLKPTQAAPKPGKPSKPADDSDDDAVVIKDDAEEQEHQGTAKVSKIPGDERETIVGAQYCGKGQSFRDGECRSDA